MGHPIEHAVGIYIGLLLLACAVAIVSKRITHLPYTIFLTLMGLIIGVTLGCLNAWFWVKRESRRE